MHDAHVKESEALEVLGLTKADDPAQVKRAYRRLLKVTKPDEDPLGFKRLRTAYEILKQQDGIGVAPGPVDFEAPQPPALRKTTFERELHALGTGQDNALRRIYLLDAELRNQPENPQLLVRLFSEMREVGLDLPSLDVLEELEAVDAAKAWTLRLQHLPDKTTTHQLRHPPADTPLVLRIKALYVLIDVHRWTGDVGAVAIWLVQNEPESALAQHHDALVQLALRLAVTGFVTDAQALMRKIHQRCVLGTDSYHNLLLQWAQQDAVPAHLLRGIAAAFFYDDDDLLEGHIEDLDRPAKAFTALRTHGPELYARFKPVLVIAPKKRRTWRSTDGFLPLPWTAASKPKPRHEPAPEPEWQPMGSELKADDPLVTMHPAILILGATLLLALLAFIGQCGRS